MTLRLTILALLLLHHLQVSADPVGRDRREVRAFKAEALCPATGRVERRSCPDHDIDHIEPLCAGGADARGNMQYIRRDDHRFKTLVDARECRKARRAAATPAR